MKKLIYMFLLLLPLLQACSDNEIGGETDDSEKVEVSIQTQVETKQQSLPLWGMEMK